MLEYRFATSRAALCLAFLAACDDSVPTFEDVQGGRASDALRADGRNPNAPAKPRVDDEPQLLADAGADPVSLPPDVVLDPSGVVLCGNAACQCNNGIDDDGDGTVDGFDVECTGGIDDDESSFATGIPGDNRDPKWQDCFFDGNSGAGDDRCRYPTECLTGALSLDDEACAVTQACRDNCQPRTPKGCDCFGCCAVELPGKSVINVTLSAACSAEKLGDADACVPCTPNPECGNPPEDGPEDPETPPDSPNGPGTPTPDAPPVGEPVCNADQAICNEEQACPVGQFCSFGCCLVVVR